jgi:hypothetical protein
MITYETRDIPFLGLVCNIPMEAAYHHKVSKAEAVK